MTRDVWAWSLRPGLLLVQADHVVRAGGGARCSIGAGQPATSTRRVIGGDGDAQPARGGPVVDDLVGVEAMDDRSLDVQLGDLASEVVSVPPGLGVARDHLDVDAALDGLEACRWIRDPAMGATTDGALWAELAEDGLLVTRPEVTVGGMRLRGRAGAETLAMDVLGLLVAMVAAAFAVGVIEVQRHGPGGGAVFGGTLLRLLVCLPVFVVALAATRHPMRAQLRSTVGWHVGQVVGPLAAGGLVSLVLWQVVHLSGVSEPSVDGVLFTCAAGVVSVGACRSIVHGRPRRTGGRARRVVIVGSGVVAGRVAQSLGARGDTEVVGFVDDDPVDRRQWLGTLDALTEVCRGHGADHVVVAFSSARAERLVDALRPLQGTLPISVVPRLFDVLPSSATVSELGAGIPALTMAPSTLGWWPTMLKRAVDVTGATAALIALSPVLLGAALAVRVSSRGPVVLRQTRIGRYGQEFKMYKFRTMVVDQPIARSTASASEVADGPFFKLKRDPRVTRAGRWLRRASIDELPQLVNVLLGHMSLVGPRPFLPEDSANIRGWASRRYSVRPGVTGLWQVSGRNDVSFDDMCRLDHLYVACWSVGLDLRILVRTVRAVLAGHGAY